MTDNFCKCNLRKKIILNIVSIEEEAKCGVSDAELVDVLDFGLAGSKGQPVLRIRYCPWCGMKAPKIERVTEVNGEEDETENWKQGYDSDSSISGDDYAGDEFSGEREDWPPGS